MTIIWLIGFDDCAWAGTLRPIANKMRASTRANRGTRAIADLLTTNRHTIYGLCFYATLFRRNHPIAQHADMVDLGLHYVAGLHIFRRIEAHAHAAGRAGRDHRARL